MVDPMAQPREGEALLCLPALGASQSAERAAADQAVTSTATPSGESSSGTSQSPPAPELGGQPRPDLQVERPLRRGGRGADRPEEGEVGLRTPGGAQHHPAPRAPVPGRWHDLPHNRALGARSSGQGRGRGAQPRHELLRGVLRHRRAARRHREQRHGWQEGGVHAGLIGSPSDRWYYRPPGSVTSPPPPPICTSAGSSTSVVPAAAAALRVRFSTYLATCESSTLTTM